MAESAAFSRRGHSGAAKDTTLATGITSGATTLDGADLSTWTGTITNGPARATLSDGTNEEEIEFTGVSSNTLTGVTRGVGGTTAQAWSAGVTLAHESSVRDFDEANRAVAKTLGQVAGNGSKFFRVNAGATDIEVVTLASSHVSDLTEVVQDIVGAMVTSNTETNITVTYDDSDGTLDFVASAGAAPALLGARGVKSAAQSITNETITAVSFDGADTFDSNSIHDPATNNTRFTIPAASDGYYEIVASVTFASSTTGLREIMLRKNGATYLKILEVPASSVAGKTSLSLSDVVPLVATDYVEICVYQTSGGALNVNGDAAGNPGVTTCAIRRVAT